MEKFRTFVTFGRNHSHKVDGVTVDKDTVYVIEGASYEQNRREAFKIFGAKFAFEYPQPHWNEGDMMKYFPDGYVGAHHERIMSEIGEIFGAHEEAIRAYKAEQRLKNTDILTRAGAHFTSHNGGLHLIIISPHSKNKVDFWPSTGKWSTRVQNPPQWGNDIGTLLDWLDPDS